LNLQKLVVETPRESIRTANEDPQGLESQMEVLRDVGAHVFASNVNASSFARDVILQRTNGGE